MFSEASVRILLECILVGVCLETDILSELYRPHTKYGEVNVFIGVCHHGGMHSHNAMGRQIPPRRQTPPPPHSRQAPPQDMNSAMGHAQQVGGMHPTGMQTCF